MEWRQFTRMRRLSHHTWKVRRDCSRAINLLVHSCDLHTDDVQATATWMHM